MLVKNVGILPRVAARREARESSLFLGGWDAHRAEKDGEMRRLCGSDPVMVTFGHDLVGERPGS
jgi:hypothetical protein